MVGGKLRISVVSHTFQLPFTANFERYILEQQRMGKELLAFEQDEGTTFILYFGEVAESMEGVANFNDLNIAMSPWRLLLYNTPSFRPIKLGKMFYFPRVVDSFADVVAIDDPVVLVTPTGSGVYGYAKVVGATKLKIKAITNNAFKSMLPNVTGRMDFIRQLQEMYDQPLTVDSVVSVLHLKATSNITCEPEYAETSPVHVAYNSVTIS